MNDQSKKLKDLKESNDAIFQELFGKKEPKNGERGNLRPDGLMYKDNFIQVNPDHSIDFIQTGSHIDKPAPGYGDFTHQDWGSDGLKWLANADFNAGIVQINKGTIDRFVGGTWMFGEFKGRVFSKSIFGRKGDDGAFFIGGKLINSTWNPSPWYFVNGTTDETQTILGLPNMNTFNQNKFNFNIISVVPGKKIVMQLESGKVHEVSVLKRLDAANSKFEYKVKNGVTGEVFSMPIKWSALRGNSVQEFEENTELSNQHLPVLFTNVFGLEFGSPIVKVMVTDSTEYGEKKIEKQGEAPEITPADLSKKQESVELTNLPFLGIQKIPRKGGSETSLYFNFPTPQLQSDFDNILRLNKAGWVNASIKIIKSALDKGFIKGAPVNYLYLSELIGKDSDADARVLGKEIVDALNTVEIFLKSFVDTLVRRVRKSGKEAGLYDVEDVKAKQLIKDRVKGLLGKSEEAAPEVPGVQKPATKKPSAPAAQEFPRMQESVRDLVQKILSENLKHF